MNQISMVRRLIGVFGFFCAVTLSNGALAASTPEIYNGSMTGPEGGQTDGLAPPGWSVVNATPEVVSSTAPTNQTGLPWELSPDSGTFAKLNGTFNPVYQEAIQQNVVSGFTPGAIYQLNFYAVNLGWYWSKYFEWYNHDGYFEFFLDDINIGHSTVLHAPGQYDQPVQWVADSISFAASAETHSLKILARTSATSADPNNSPPTNAYMGIDGLRFTKENCDNGVDDDFDGLVDGDDEDCQEPPAPEVSFSTRCLHKPLYPQDGEAITIYADVIDQDGNTVEVDALEIYINNRDLPHTVVTGPVSRTQVTYRESGTRIFYGCRSTREDGGVAFTGFRTADIGVPENKDWAALPVVYHGPMDEKVDLVFFAEEDAYAAGAVDPVFQDEMYELIFDGLLEIPWYVRNFESFNIWLAFDTAGVRPKNASDSSKKCKKDKPPRFKKKYGFADAAGILHKEACRDNAAFKTYSTRYRGHRLQVVAHEIGHAAFSLSDEYTGADSLYFTLPDYPNLLPTLSACRSAAERRGANPDDCRSLILDGASGFFVGGLWIFEPNYDDTGEPWSGTPDLMQMTGSGDSCLDEEGNSKSCLRVGVGISEIDRMTWKLDKCRNGRC